MNKAQEEAAYFAVIPAPVRYDTELSAAAKLLYCEITSLCKKKGYCWATNQYFSELLNGVSISTISRLISQLERQGHIRTETTIVATGSERRIFVDVCYAGQAGYKDSEGNTQKPQAPQGDAQNAQGGVCKNAERGVRKNRKQNDYNEDNTPYSPPKGDAPAEAPEPGTSSGSAGQLSRQPAAAPEDKPQPAPKPKTRRSRARKSVPAHAPERFELFWAIYPGVSGSRLKAVAEWDALAPDDGLIDEMARALKRQMETQQWREGIGIPHAFRWLRDRRWTDKLPETAKTWEGGTYEDDWFQ